MKKITFILFALISGTVFAQNDSDQAVATAQVNAEIVSPIGITSVGNLNFGRIIGDTEGGTVTIKLDNTRELSNEDMNVPTTSNAPSAAVFTIKAANSYNYSISIPDVTLEGAGDAMAVTFNHNLADKANVGTGKEETLTVGGVLTVKGNQAEGDYAGTVTVTVAYE